MSRHRRQVLQQVFTNDSIIRHPEWTANQLSIIADNNLMRIAELAPNHPNIRDSRMLVSRMDLKTQNDLRNRLDAKNGIEPLIPVEMVTWNPESLKHRVIKREDREQYETNTKDFKCCKECNTCNETCSCRDVHSECTHVDSCDNSNVREGHFPVTVLCRQQFKLQNGEIINVIGVRTMENIKKGHAIGVYAGQAVSRIGGSDDLYRYTFDLSKAVTSLAENEVIEVNAERYSNSMAFINSPPSASQENVECKIVRTCNTILPVIVATRYIKAKEYLLFFYGTKYWSATNPAGMPMEFMDPLFFPDKVTAKQIPAAEPIPICINEEERGLSSAIEQGAQRSQQSAEDVVPISIHPQEALSLSTQQAERSDPSNVSVYSANQEIIAVIGDPVSEVLSSNTFPASVATTKKKKKSRVPAPSDGPKRHLRKHGSPLPYVHQPVEQDEEQVEVADKKSPKSPDSKKGFKPGCQIHLKARKYKKLDPSIPPKKKGITSKGLSGMWKEEEVVLVAPGIYKKKRDRKSSSSPQSSPDKNKAKVNPPERKRTRQFYANNKHLDVGPSALDADMQTGFKDIPQKVDTGLSPERLEKLKKQLDKKAAKIGRPIILLPKQVHEKTVNNRKGGEVPPLQPPPPQPSPPLESVHLEEECMEVSIDMPASPVDLADNRKCGEVPRPQPSPPQPSPPPPSPPQTSPPQPSPPLESVHLEEECMEVSIDMPASPVDLAEDLRVSSSDETTEQPSQQEEAERLTEAEITAMISAIDDAFEKFKLKKPARRASAAYLQLTKTIEDVKQFINVQKQENAALKEPKDPIPNKTYCISGVSVTEEELNSLKENKWLFDKVIDATLTKTCIEVSKTSLVNMVYIPLDIMQLLQTGEPQSKQAFQTYLVKAMTKATNESKKPNHYVIMTLYSTNHYYIAVADIHSKFVEVFDPLQPFCSIDDFNDDFYSEAGEVVYNRDPHRLYEMLQAYRIRIGTSKKEYLLDMLKGMCSQMSTATKSTGWEYRKANGTCPFIRDAMIPVQNDDNSCGLLVIAFIQKAAYLLEAYSEHYSDMLWELPQPDFSQWLLSWLIPE